MKTLIQTALRRFSPLILVVLGVSAQAQSFTVTNYTFDTSASANPPAWGLWPYGAGAYITNGWNSSDVSNNPSSGSLEITSTFTGANQQSVVWTGPAGDFNPPLNGDVITNFSCYLRFDPSSPTNATTDSYGSIAFYLSTAPAGGLPFTQIGGYYSIPAGDTNWVNFSIPLSISGNVYGIVIQLETYGNALTGTSKMYVDDVLLTGGTNSPISGISTVDWNTVYQRIDGFGASSAWNGSWNTAEANLLFSTNTNVVYKSVTYNGVGLSLLRNHIAYAGSTASNAIPTTVETSIMQMAQARGARVWSTPWTPPAGFKSTNDIYDTNKATASGIDGGSYLGSGGNITNVNYAAQLANYVNNMQTNYGVNIYALSVQNEPDANVTNYEACQWSGTQIHDFVTNLYSALAAQGLGSTKIIVPESQNWSDPKNFTSTVMNDPNVASDVGIVACHNYDGTYGPANLTKNNYGKPLWETEVALLSGSDSSIANGVYYAQRIYQFMTQANANAYHYWWLVASGSGNEGLLDTSAAVTKRLFTFGQYSRFVRPDFYRINATSSQTSTLISAYKDSASTSFAIVAVNTNVNTDVIQTFNLGHFSSVSVTPWVTSGALSLAPQTTLTVTNNSFTYDLPALSVVTFVGIGNTAPSIAAVPSQTDNVGVTLLVTNSASDSDLPAQSLTFGPANAFPTGAAVNATNGVFSWRPLVAEANTTNLIQIQVTDSGSPALSATNSFDVIVNPVANPVIGAVTYSPGGQITLNVSGPQGPDYTLLTSTNLLTWEPLLTNSSPATPFVFIDTNTTDAARYYQIQIGP